MNLYLFGQHIKTVVFSVYIYIDKFRFGGVLHTHIYRKVQCDKVPQQRFVAVGGDKHPFLRAAHPEEICFFRQLQIIRFLLE